MSADERIIGGARVRVFPTKEALVAAAAQELAALARKAAGQNRKLTVALAGGSTPADLYRALVDLDIPWANVHVFFGDERHVPPAHPDSNYRMAHETLLGPAAVAEDNVHRIAAEQDAPAAALTYEEHLRGFFGDGAPPRFDLVLLGLGTDGHTASLFPQTAAIGELERWVVAHHVAKFDADRITLTPVVINAAARVWFVATGERKAEILAEVLKGPREPERLPAQVVAPTDGELRWYVDAAAADQL